jgi:phenylalanyl-tRNA synthetase alpha subunit
LRNEQRLELDEWKRNKKMQEEEERKRIRQQYNDTPQEIDRWLTDWKKQRKVIEEKIDRWKVF